MRLIAKRIVLIFACSTTLASAASCLDKMAPLLASKQANLSYWSQTPYKYYVQTASGSSNGQCVTNYTALKAYLDQHYRKSAAHYPWISLSWNYLSLNGLAVYDPLARISPRRLQADYQDFMNDDNVIKNGLWISNQFNYKPLSVVNQDIGCYSFNEMTVVTDTAHPAVSVGFACSIAGSGKPLPLLSVVAESEVVSKLIQSKYIQDSLHKANLSASGISSLAALADLLNQANDDELGCYSSGLTSDDTSFAITKLNANGTIDISLGLNSQYSVCSSLLRQVSLTGLHPKQEIKQVIPAANF